MFDHHNMSCGMTSVGERGQVVIPVSIREEMNLKKGEKIMVFCRHKNFIGLVKSEEMSKHLKEMLSQIEGVN